MTYTAPIEEIQALPLDEKIEIHSLLDKYLIEEKRKKIFLNHQEVIKMADNGELKFSSDIDELMNTLE